MPLHSKYVYIIYIYICTHYIYIERERDDMCICIIMYVVYMLYTVHIYIYIDRMNSRTQIVKRKALTSVRPLAALLAAAGTQNHEAAI